MGRLKMYRCCSLLFLLGTFNLNVLAQSVNFEDGFEDGDFTEKPAWIGDTDDYTVSIGNQNYLLQLNAVSAGPGYLSTPSTSVVGFWEFYVAFDSFEPSGSNKSEVFLMSDIADLTGPVNGYALKAGESGTDVFRLVRNDEGMESATILSDTTVISSNGDGNRIRVTRDSSGGWKIEVGSGYEGRLLDAGDRAIDNTHTTSAYFGIKTTFTSTRSDKFYYDFKIDLPPFSAADITANSGTIDLTFNRPYDQATVQITDFQINNGIGTPSSILFPDVDKIRLIFSDPLPSNSYSLALSDIRDELGDPLAPDTILDFTIFGMVEKGDIIINEFMYDPPAGLPEYVELRNTTSKYLDIQGWQLGDQNGRGTVNFDSFTFPPNTFLVLSADTTALYNRFGSRNYLKMSSSNFPSLNNSGDAIRIFDNEVLLLDSLFYTPDWGGEDIALERRSATAPASSPANWGDSPQGTGTPGAANQIAQDHTPPELTGVEVVNSTTLELLFSEEIKRESAEIFARYSINPTVQLQQVIVAENRVTLFLADNLVSGRHYDIAVRNIQDIFGNTLTEQTKTFTFVEYASVQPGDIVTNEILYLRAEDGGPEFIELYNTTGKNFDLSGWLIGDAGGSATLPEGTRLLANRYLVLTDNPGFANSLTDAQHIPGFPSLNDAGDSIYLQDSEGNTLDSLSYSSDWGGNTRGISLERRDPLAASNDPANWTTGTATGGHTAAVLNSTYQPDQTSPNMIFAKALSDNIVQVYFDEFVRITHELNLQIDGAPLKIISFDSTNANFIKLKIPKGKKFHKAMNITVRNLSDVRGNLTSSSDIPISFQIQPTDVVINEIMYQPLIDPEDNLPNQSEYIEIHNTRNYAISLEGVFLSDAPDENGEVRTLLPVSTQTKWIAPNSFALFYADPEPQFEKSRVAQFFKLDAGYLSSSYISTIRIDRSTLSLASSGDAVFLRDSTGAAIDSVFYDPSWHNPNLMDTRGIALERVNPGAASNDPSNWSSSVTLKGGTPGFENSIYQADTIIPEQADITFSSNPFSPDDDGFEDHLMISYRLDEPDYLLKVTIYDRYGRLIRRLADGDPAGPEGFLIWDGRKDDGTRNRIGIYIVVFEAYNSSAGRNRALKESVVLARRLN